MDVIGECNMADSVAKLSDPPPGTPDILKTPSIEEQAVLHPTESQGSLCSFVYICEGGSGEIECFGKGLQEYGGVDERGCAYGAEGFDGTQPDSLCGKILWGG